MANEEHWAQRRQRVAKCKVHGLHYDPRLTSGCALCRKEGTAAGPRRKPQMVLMLLPLLGVAVILYRVVGPGSAVRADSESTVAPAVPATAAASTQLDPGPYRASVEAVERALFQSSAASLTEMSEQIVYALEGLRRDLDERQEGEAAIAKLDELGDSLSGEVLSLERLRSLREEWARLRNRTFLSAGWFVVPSRVDARTDRAALLTYRATADGLFVLLDEGADLARELGPSTPNLVDRDERARNLEAWRSFRTDWQQRIVDLRRELPPRPTPDARHQVLLATQRLEQAFARTSALAAGDLPELAHVDAAFDAAEQARQAFDELLYQ